MKIFPDCTDLFAAVEGAVTAGSMAGFVTSPLGRLISATCEGAEYDGEPITLHFTRHTIETSAFTLGKKGVCAADDASRMLGNVIGRLVSTGHASVDGTVEDYRAISAMARKGRADGDTEDATVLEEAHRLAARGEKMVLTSEDGGMRWWANHEGLAATQIPQVLLALQ